MTARRGTSTIDPRLSGGLQHVVYGHAILGDWYDDNPQATVEDWLWRREYQEADDAARRARFDNCRMLPGGPVPAAFPTAAQQWHLSRRSTLILDYDATNPLLNPADPKFSPAVAADLDDSVASAPAKWALVEGRQDVVAAAGFGFLTNIVYLDPRSGAATLPALPAWYARSEMDLTPPARLADRLGHFFLLKCASFKVEFAVDLPELGRLGEVLWIDPADLVPGWNTVTVPDDKSETLKRIERMLLKIQNERLGGNNAPEYLRLVQLRDVDLEPTPDPNVDTRFGLLPDGHPMARWYTTPALPSSSPPPATGEPDPLFPAALRITADVYDDEGRFERPIRQVMVLKVGG